MVIEPGIVDWPPVVTPAQFEQRGPRHITLAPYSS